MDNKAKQMAAALSAVSTFLQLEQEALAAQAAQAAKPPAPAMANVWGICGRQAMMQVRDLMHLKAFNRLR